MPGAATAPLRALDAAGFLPLSLHLLGPESEESAATGSQHDPELAQQRPGRPPTLQTTVALAAAERPWPPIPAARAMLRHRPKFCQGGLLAGLQAGSLGGWVTCYLFTRPAVWTLHKPSSPEPWVKKQCRTKPQTGLGTTWPGVQRNCVNAGVLPRRKTTGLDLNGQEPPTFALEVT